MTAPTAAQPPVTRGDAIPLSRLVRVELRKLVDTRAGFWLTVTIIALSGVVAVVKLATGGSDLTSLNFGAFFSPMTIPMGILLPILAILLVTSEWSQRGALTTFTMEPRRERVVIAKLAASLIAAAVALIAALVFAAIANVVAGIAFDAPAGSWDISAATLVNTVLLQLLGMLMGFGFAALLLNTPAAIVLYFAVPTVMSLVTGLVTWVREHLAEWVDPAMAQAPLTGQQWPSGSEWAHIVVSTIIWIVLPLAFGIYRIMRSEVK